MLSAEVSSQFASGPKYLNTASVGLPPKRALDALHQSLRDWEAGDCEPPAYDAEVDRARTAFAHVAGVLPSTVGIIGQVSVAAGLVASSLDAGSRVLCAEEDFTSVTFPMLADGRLDVRFVPLERLLDSIDRDIDLVAVSAVQSADGRVLDLDALASACDHNNVRTFLDVTQAAGWLSLGADRFDVVSCGAYKWLCSPRGTGYLAVRPDVDWLIPRHAGWYSAEDRWSSLYGPPMRLAEGGRRFDASPAWFDYVASAHSLELLAETGVQQIGEHSVGLANEMCVRLGMDPSNSAVVSVETNKGDLLVAEGFRVATRAGKVRMSFYVYNTMADVEAAHEILAN
ncbi:MAG: aminotransferase class V-fold PLP-dependent enzyme [Actinomycetia bacterium]|nr:aminotransferase class V-fold PLP-dependent enzyme [Actinomycetes bacterium]